MCISENIRRYRKKLELTQAQLADCLGVTVQAVSRWETGSGMPDTAQIVPLARALNIKTDTLLSYRDQQQEYERRWQHALQYSHGDTAALQTVCLEILEEDPNNVAFLYRAALNESYFAKEADTEEIAHSHWSMSRQYTNRLLRLDPDHESAKEHLVEVLSALGLDDEAVAQAYRCTDSSRALLSCLKGESLRRHRQKRIDEKFQELLMEIDATGMPEVTEALIRAAIPDGNYQHYASFLSTHGWRRALDHAARDDHDAVMAELHRLLELSVYMDSTIDNPRFTAPAFDLLEGFQNPPGIPTFVEQFIHEMEYLFPQLVQREDYQALLTKAKEMQKGTA